MTKRDIFSTYTLDECVTYCLHTWPHYSYILISYENNVFSRDAYNCMCAHKHAFDKNTRLPEYKCNNMCPGNNEKYRYKYRI